MTQRQIAAEILDFCKTPRKTLEIVFYFRENFPEVVPFTIRDRVSALMLAGLLKDEPFMLDGKFHLMHHATNRDPELFFAALDAEEASDGSADDREAIDAAWRAVRAEM